MLIHLNGNFLCAVDVKTTGLDAAEHEIYEIGMIPLNSNFSRRDDRKPLDLRIKPTKEPDWGYLERKNLNPSLKRAIETGLPSHVAMSLFERWFEDLKLPFRKRIAPVGYGYTLESRFLRQWLGSLSYMEMFDDTELREVQVLARFLNDMASLRQTDYPFKKVRLNYLASTLKVWNDYGRLKSAIHDAAITGDVYRALMEMHRKELTI